MNEVVSKKMQKFLVSDRKKHTPELLESKNAHKELIQTKESKEIPEVAQKELMESKIFIKPADPIQNKKFESSQSQKVLIPEFDSTFTQKESNSVLNEQKVLLQEPSSLSINLELLTFIYFILESKPVSPANQLQKKLIEAEKPLAVRSFGLN